MKTKSKFHYAPEEASEIDLRLAILDAVRPSHVTLTHREIAEFSGLSFQGIYYIELRALKKIRRWLWRNGFKHEAATFEKPNGNPRRN